MKVVAAILILSHLILPALCFGKPCEGLVVSAAQLTVAADTAGGCQHDHDSDCCETTCCCAGYTLLNPAEILYAGLTSKLLSAHSPFTLPGYTATIYIPPQHRS